MYLDSYLGRGGWIAVADGASVINIPPLSYSLNLVPFTLETLLFSNMIGISASSFTSFEVQSLEHTYSENSENSHELEWMTPRFVASYELNPKQVTRVYFRYRAPATHAHLIAIATDSMRSMFHVAIRYVKHPIWSGPKYDGSY